MPHVVDNPTTLEFQSFFETCKKECKTIEAKYRSSYDVKPERVVKLGRDAQVAVQNWLRSNLRKYKNRPFLLFLSEKPEIAYFNKPVVRLLDATGYRDYWDLIYRLQFVSVKNNEVIEVDLSVAPLCQALKLTEFAEVI